MKLKNVQEIWGIPISIIQERTKIYRRWVMCVYLINLIFVSVITIALSNFNSPLWLYTLVVLILVLASNIIIETVSRASNYEAFKFYRRLDETEVHEKQYSITREQLYSILYCLHYKRLNPDSDMLGYCDSLFILCYEDKYNAKKIMKYLSKYEAHNDEVVTLRCTVLNSHGNEYLVAIPYCADIKKGS